MPLVATRFSQGNQWNKTGTTVTALLQRHGRRRQLKSDTFTAKKGTFTQETDVLGLVVTKFLKKSGQPHGTKKARPSTGVSVIFMRARVVERQARRMSALVLREVLNWHHCLHRQGCPCPCSCPCLCFECRDWAESRANLAR